MLRSMTEHSGPELSEEEMETRKAKTLRLAESANLQYELADAWRRFRNAQAHRQAHQESEDELGDAAMALEEALVASSIAWLEKHWGNHKPCPYCGSPDWTVYRPKRAGDLGLYFPVTCDNCGNTAFIDAVQAGVVEPGEMEDF